MWSNQDVRGFPPFLSRTMKQGDSRNKTDGGYSFTGGFPKPIPVCINLLTDELLPRAAEDGSVY